MARVTPLSIPAAAPFRLEPVRRLDKPPEIDDLIAVLKFIRRQLWMVCTLALLAMTGGQVVHAGAELLCHHEQGTETHTTCPEQDECPDGHCCCNVSSCMSSTLPELAGRVFVSVCDPTGSFRIRNETCGEGPCQEIDHPPQLA